MSELVFFGYAPAKIILFGEHAVVYGQPAIAATLDRGLRVVVTAREPEDGPVLKTAGAGAATLARPDPPTADGRPGEGPERLRAALSKLVELCGERTRKLQFSVDGEIPAGSGLGSSAALAIALLRGVEQFFGDTPAPPSVLVDRAFAIERVFHGNPSGVDHSVIAHGGCISFVRGPGGESAGAVIKPLTLPRRLRLAVGLAGPHAGTAHAVAALKERARRHPEHYQRIYDGIGALCKDAQVHLEQGAYAAVGELMDLNQGYLNALGVSTPAIEALCAIARERGALGAKLTGAGGGGAVIALVDDDPAPVVRAFQAAGHTAFAAEIQAGAPVEGSADRSDAGTNPPSSVRSLASNPARTVSAPGERP